MGRVDVVIVRIHRHLDRLHDLLRGTGEGAPAGSEDCDGLNVMSRESVKQLYRKELAQICPGEHNSRKRQLSLRLCKKVLPHDEAGVDDGHIPQSGILVDEGAHDGEVDICRCQLAAINNARQLSGAFMKREGLRTPKSGRYLGVVVSATF